MLKKIKHMKCEDIMILTSFANIDTKSYNDFKYKDLLQISSHSVNKNVEMNVEEVIDKLMFDNYDIYLKIKERMIQNAVIEEMIEDNVQKQLFLESKKNIEKYIKLYEKLMLTSKFEYADIRSVQRFLLQEKMAKEIRRENYEVCAELKKKISEI